MTGLQDFASSDVIHYSHKNTTRSSLQQPSDKVHKRLTMVAAQKGTIVLLNTPLRQWRQSTTRDSMISLLI